MAIRRIRIQSFIRWPEWASWYFFQWTRSGIQWAGQLWWSQISERGWSDQYAWGWPKVLDRYSRTLSFYPSNSWCDSRIWTRPPRGWSKNRIRSFQCFHAVHTLHVFDFVRGVICVDSILLYSRSGHRYNYPLYELKVVYVVYHLLVLSCSHLIYHQRSGNEENILWSLYNVYS
jgi:hypothetical protein